MYINEIDNDPVEGLCPSWGGCCTYERCVGPDCPYHWSNPDPFADKRGSKIPDGE